MNDELVLVDWTEVETDSVARWEHDDRDLCIDVAEYSDTIRVALSRRIEAEGYETWLDTTVLTVQTIEQAESMVGSLADSVTDGIGRVVAIGAEEVMVDDEEFVNFYVIFESALPEGIEVEDIMFEDEMDGEDSVEAVSAMEIDEDEIAEYEGVRIEIYPVLFDDITVHE